MSRAALFLLVVNAAAVSAAVVDLATELLNSASGDLTIGDIAASPSPAPTLPLSTTTLPPVSHEAAAVAALEAAAAASATNSTGLHKCMGGMTKDLERYRGCTIIYGYLAIYESTASDLGALSSLRRIVELDALPQPGGNAFVLSKSPFLRDLEALAKLEHIGGGVAPNTPVLGR